MNNASRPSALPFSRPLDASTVGEAAMPVKIVAKETEMIAMARLDGLAGIDQLEADLTISREGRSGLRVTGVVKARVRQTCVVSLEPFDAEVLEPVDVHYLPEADIAHLRARRPKLEEAGGAEDDLPDPIVGGRIDLGALTAEYLVLGLDPYPRKPGVAYVGPQPGAEDAAAVSPFAALSRLKSERPL